MPILHGESAVDDLEGAGHADIAAMVLEDGAVDELEILRVVEAGPAAVPEFDAVAASGGEAGIGDALCARRADAAIAVGGVIAVGDEGAGMRIHEECTDGLAGEDGSDEIVDGGDVLLLGVDLDLADEFGKGLYSVLSMSQWTPSKAAGRPWPFSKMTTSPWKPSGC